jgi:hypothetical protein
LPRRKAEKFLESQPEPRRRFDRFNRRQRVDSILKILDGLDEEDEKLT